MLSNIEHQLKKDNVLLPEIVSTNVNKKKEVRENDAVRKESAEKKRKESFKRNREKRWKKDTKKL